METFELIIDPKTRKCIADFVNSPHFLKIKDAFVSHTPKGKDSECSVAVAYGKSEGTVYVFNRLEELSREKPVAEKPPNKVGPGKDPDLED